MGTRKEARNKIQPEVHLQTDLSECGSCLCFVDRRHTYIYIYICTIITHRSHTYNRYSTRKKGMMMMGNKIRVCLVLIFVVLIQKGDAIWMSLPAASSTKCVTEEIHNNVVVLGDYVVISDDNVHPTPTISAKV